MKVLLCLIYILSGMAAAEYPYCFRFTWLGPFMDKEHISTVTCDDLRDDATNIPCRLPLVATYNDTIPDTVDLWSRNQQKPDLFGCPMTPGQACVKYTYTYNKGIQNITYMCAKVNATTGCYHQKYISGLDVEVCVCESTRGALPCNAAHSLRLTPGSGCGVGAARWCWWCAERVRRLAINLLVALSLVWFSSSGTTDLRIWRTGS